MAAHGATQSGGGAAEDPVFGAGGVRDSLSAPGSSRRLSPLPAALVPGKTPLLHRSLSPERRGAARRPRRTAERSGMPAGGASGRGSWVL